MTLEGFKKGTEDLSKVEFIGFTSLQKIYIERIDIKSFTINDSEMTVEFDTLEGLHFHLISMIVIVS